MQFWVSKRAGVPLPDQLTAQVRLAIASGELQPGDALPSVRMAAHRCGVHWNTICSAYRDLRRDGWLTSARGQRMFVAGREQRGDSVEATAEEFAYVADPDSNLAEILALELQERAGVLATVFAAETESERRAKHTVFALEGRGPDCPGTCEVVPLWTRSLRHLVRDAPRLSGREAVLVLSRSHTVLDRARVLMSALGVDLQAVHFRDANSPDWDRGLMHMDLVICDGVAARDVPARKRTFVLSLIAENSIADAQRRFPLRSDSSAPGLACYRSGEH